MSTFNEDLKKCLGYQDETSETVKEGDLINLSEDPGTIMKPQKVKKVKKVKKTDEKVKAKKPRFSAKQKLLRSLNIPKNKQNCVKIQKNKKYCIVLKDLERETFEILANKFLVE